jgi:hypothetical protein
MKLERCAIRPGLSSVLPSQGLTSLAPEQSCFDQADFNNAWLQQQISGFMYFLGGQMMVGNSPDPLLPTAFAQLRLAQPRLE